MSAKEDHKTIISAKIVIEPTVRHDPVLRSALLKSVIPYIRSRREIRAENVFHSGHAAPFGYAGFGRLYRTPWNREIIMDCLGLTMKHPIS